MEEKVFDGYGRFNFYQTNFSYKLNKLKALDRRSSFEDKWMNPKGIWLMKAREIFHADHLGFMMISVSGKPYNSADKFYLSFNLKG